MPEETPTPVEPVDRPDPNAAASVSTWKEFFHQVLVTPSAALRLAAVVLVLAISMVMLVAYLVYGTEPGRPLLTLAAVGAILLIVGRVTSGPLLGVAIVVMGTMIASEGFLLSLVPSATETSGFDSDIAGGPQFVTAREELLNLYSLAPVKENRLEDLLDFSLYIEPRVFEAVKEGGRHFQLFLAGRPLDSFDTILKYLRTTHRHRTAGTRPPGAQNLQDRRQNHQRPNARASHHAERRPAQMELHH